MILTTTPTVEGRTIIEYKGIVFGEVITGVNFIKDFGASLRNFFGGRVPFPVTSMILSSLE